MKAPFGLIVEAGCSSAAPDRKLGLGKSGGATGRDQIRFTTSSFKLETTNLVVIYGNYFCFCNMTWNVDSKVLYIFLSVTDVFFFLNILGLYAGLADLKVFFKCLFAL